MQQFSRLQNMFTGGVQLCPVFFPHKQQDECMKELNQELAWHMARAGLQSETRSARPPSRGQRHSHSHSVSWSCSPQPYLGEWRRPRDWKKTPLQDDQSWEGIPILGAGMVEVASESLSSMPKQVPVTLHYPPWSHPADEQLSCSMKDLNLQTRPCQSRSRAQWDDAPTLAEKLKKQVRFNVGGDLGNDPKLPQGLTLFLAEVAAEEWDDTNGPYTPMPKDSPQLPPSEDPLHHPTHTGGARPNVPAQPSANQSQSWLQPRLEEPDPVNHLHRWIHAEMEKITHPQLVEELKPSGRVCMVIHLIRESLSDSEALQWACWQAVAFRLPLA